MQKINILLLLAFLATLTSCVTKDISIVKRKYSLGYYVNIHHQKKENSVLSNESKCTISSAKANTPNKTTENTVVELKNATTTALLSEIQKINTATISSKPLYSSKYKLNNKEEKSILLSLNVEQHKSKALYDKPSVINTKISKALKVNMLSAEESTILLVILSLFPFIALIAMYLKDGNRITMNFWVDLLLHLTVIGYAIFAILVVLDIIDLS